MCPQHSAEGPAQSSCLPLPNGTWMAGCAEAGLLPGSVSYSPLDEEGAALCKKSTVAHQALEHNSL